MSERELPEGESRKQIVVIDEVREYIKDRAGEQGKTVSQYLRDDVFPDDWETTYHGYEDDEIVYLKVTPQVDEMVDRMTGGRMDKGEVVAFWALIDALQDGDIETAAEIVDHVPEMVWDRLEGQL